MRHLLWNPQWDRLPYCTTQLLPAGEFLDFVCSSLDPELVCAPSTQLCCWHDQQPDNCRRVTPRFELQHHHPIRSVRGVLVVPKLYTKLANSLLFCSAHRLSVRRMAVPALARGQLQTRLFTYDARPLCQPADGTGSVLLWGSGQG